MSAQRVTEVHRGGLVLDVVDTGPLDGDVVVLLHGFPERATSWAAVAARLHEQGYRTLALDQRGYATRARPRRRRDHRSAELTADVAALVEQVGGPVHVVGHDWGAIVAWSLTLGRPDLVRTLTALSVPHPAAFLRSMVTSRQGLHSWYMLAFQVPRLPERLAARRDPRLARWLRAGGMTDDDVARFHREVVDDGALRGGLMWYRALPWMDRALLRRHASVPTTMLWSDGDLFLARAGVDRCARHVDADYELVVLRGLSHWLPTQAPDAVAEVVLRRIGGAA